MRATGSLNGFDAGLSVERHERPEVNDFHLNVLFSEKVSGLQGDVKHGPPRHHGDLATATNDLGSSELVRFTVLDALVHGRSVDLLIDVHAPSGQTAPQTVETDVFQHQHRVGQVCSCLLYTSPSPRDR